MKIFIELYFNTFIYINFNDICSCIINKKFFMKFYPTDYYGININKLISDKSIIFNEYHLNILKAHNELRASIPDKKITFLLQYKDINFELFCYTSQRKKFLDIIKNISNGTENFYPYESIHEFKINIGVINVLISNLLESSNNLNKFL